MMASAPETNMEVLCARLDDFRFERKFTDLTIICDNQEFPCHRVVLAARCKYFQAMFDNECRESVSGRLNLGDNMKAAILEQILKFLYTGDAEVTSDNILDLLVASDYFGVASLEDYCLEIVLRSGLTELRVDLLDVLLFAYATNRNSIINVLQHCNMTKRLRQFFTTDDFLAISIDLFVLVISKLWRSPADDALMSAIRKWIGHAPADRGRHAPALVNLLNRQPTATEHSEAICDDSAAEQLLGLSRIAAAAAAAAAAEPTSPLPSLYVYVKNYHELKTYAIKPSGSVSVPHHGPQGTIGDFRCVSAPKLGLYHFNYVDSKTSWFRHSAAGNLLDSASEVPLTHPPVRPTFIDVCNLSDRGLFLLQRDELSTAAKCRKDSAVPTWKTRFSSEERKRGIFFYNFELDDWFAVPAMKKRYESCMALSDNVVYLIGGAGSLGSVQCYDHREGLWHLIEPTILGHFNPQACVHGQHVYVGSGRSTLFERYNLRAGKWERIEKTTPFGQLLRLAPFGSGVWALSTDRAAYADRFDTRSSAWSVLRVLPDASSSVSRILDGAVLS